jgi:hypothetical protein
MISTSPQLLLYNAGVMSHESSPSVSAFVFPAALFMLTGWGGLAALVTNSNPINVLPRWLFFFLLTIAVTGTFLVPVAYLNQRFPSLPPADGKVITRQSTWFGILVASAAWLQTGRVLTTPILILLAIGFALIEFLLRMNERSQWKA